MNIDEIYEAVKNEACIKSYKIKKEKVDNLTIFDSKFGRIPYWDFSKEFPVDSKGEKLNLLAQINFGSCTFFVGFKNSGWNTQCIPTAIYFFC